MATIQVKIPEELYNSFKVLGYQKRDMEKEFLENVVLQLYAKHTISMGKGASILGVSIQAFRHSEEMRIKHASYMRYKHNY